MNSPILNRTKKLSANPSKFLFIIILPVIILSCQPGAKTNNDLAITPDTAFNKLFSPDSGGVTGADGIFSVPLPDGESVFLMGDCFLGVVKNNKRDMKTKMLNNSFILINKEQTAARAIYKGTYNNPSSMIVPEQSGDTNRWYWPGHGFAEDSLLYVFALNMYTDPALIVKSDKKEDELDEADRMTEAMFAFQVYGVDLLTFKLPEFEQIATQKVEYAYNTDIHYGNSVFAEGKYLYFLGTKNYSEKAKPHIARTESGKYPYHTNWEFYNGKEWVKDYMQSKPIDIDISVSEQFSLFRIREKYVLLIQEKGTGDIYTYTSDVPYEGFTNKTFIYHTPERENGVKGMTTYNAMAHPQYIKDGELLVSYCTNAAVREIFNDANNYRPRFIRVPLEIIDSSFRK